MTDTKELRKLAEAATPGPWIAAGPSYGATRPVRLNSVVQEVQGDESLSIADDINTDEDAEYIAAAGPAVIIELLNTIDRLTAERDKCGSGAGCLFKDAMIDSLTAERDACQLDAERYRFWRNRYPVTFAPTDMTPEDVDRFSDSAITKEKT